MLMGCDKPGPAHQWATGHRNEGSNGCRQDSRMWDSDTCPPPCNITIFSWEPQMQLISLPTYKILMGTSGFNPINPPRQISHCWMDIPEDENNKYSTRHSAGISDIYGLRQKRYRRAIKRKKWIHQQVSHGPDLLQHLFKGFWIFYCRFCNYRDFSDTGFGLFLWQEGQ